MGLVTHICAVSICLISKSSLYSFFLFTFRYLLFCGFFKILSMIEKSEPGKIVYGDKR